MFSFITRSFFQKIITLFLASVLCFAIIHLAPGDPTEVSPLNPKFTKADVERLKEALDLDKPLHIQYVLFYKRLFTGELKSYKDNRPVLRKIFERFLYSLPLFIVGTALSWSLAFPVGVRAALRRGSPYDRVATFVSYLLIGLPSFVLAYYLIRLVVPVLNVSVIGLRTFGQEGAQPLFRLNDRIWHLVLPSILGASGGIAVLSRYVRSQMLEIINQDYVRTAKAKGLPEDTVYYKHALRNALLPFVTIFPLILPALIGGSVIVETIFAWPGMGRLGYEAVMARDYPIVLSLSFIVAILVVVATFISDILYMIIDPRVKL